MMSHEKLDAYQVALQMLADAHALGPKIGSRFKKMADELERASLSVPLNIAEGVGRASVADKRHFFVMARGSVFECGAIYDSALIKELITPEEHTGAKERAERVAGMLTGLAF